MRPRELQKQPVPQLPALLLRVSDDVRHDPPLQVVGATDQGGPGNPAHRSCVPRFGPPWIQQHVSLF